MVWAMTSQTAAAEVRPVADGPEPAEAANAGPVDAPRATTMKVTAAAANAQAMAALQENGVRPASDAAGTNTSRSIIAVSLITRSFARVLCSEPRALPQILRTRSTAVPVSSSVGCATLSVF